MFDEWGDPWYEEDWEEVREMGEASTKDALWKHSKYYQGETVTDTKVEPVNEAEPRLTIWKTIMKGTVDQRCALKEMHIHDILHALGLNPSAMWPPDTDEFMTMMETES